MPTVRDDYPTATELRQKLATLSEGMDWSVPASFSYADAIDGAIADWENDSGWYPFKAIAFSKTYDPPGMVANEMAPQGGGQRVLLLRAPFLTVTSVTMSGQVVPASQYMFRPTGRREHGWTLRFAYPVYGPANCITVTGTAGYQSVGIPANVYNAVIHRAIYTNADLLKMMISGGLGSWKEGNAEEDYEGGIRDQIALWRQNYDSEVKRYKDMAAWL